MLNRSLACLEAVVGAGLHGLGLLQAFVFVGAGLMTLFEVGQDEVAGLVQVGDVGGVLVERLSLQGGGALGFAQGLFQVSLGRLLVGDGLGVLLFGLVGIGQQFFVVALGGLFFVLHVQVAGLQFFGQLVHERGDGAGTLSLGRVGGGFRGGRQTLG